MILRAETVQMTRNQDGTWPVSLPDEVVSLCESRAAELDKLNFRLFILVDDGFARISVSRKHDGSGGWMHSTHVSRSFFDNMVGGRGLGGITRYLMRRVERFEAEAPGGPPEESDHG